MSVPAGGLEAVLSAIEQKHPGIRVQAYEAAHKIELMQIIVPDEMRGGGIGTEAIKAIQRYAKSVNKPIVIRPAAERGRKGDLERFYRRLGFVHNRGRNKDFVLSSPMADTMYWRPGEVGFGEGFRTWLEAVVSSESVGEAIEKTLRLMVDGEWNFKDRRSVVVNSAARKINVAKDAELIRGGRLFRLSINAEFPEGGGGDGAFAHRRYDTSDGLDGLEIKCMVWMGGKMIGQRGFSGDSSGRSPLGKTLPFKKPMDLAAWVNDIADNPPDNDDDDDDDDDLDPSPPKPQNKFVYT